MTKLLWEIAKIFRLRFFYLVSKGEARKLTALYVLVASFVSLSTLGAVAYFFNWPLIYPALGPTAFLIFYAPARSMSWPRNCVLGHLAALCCGLSLYFLALRFFPEKFLGEAFTLFETVIASGAMALSALLMVILDILHPPAASTAMLAATGYFDTPPKILGLALALALLSLEGAILHRMAGVIYPWWRIKGELEDPPIRTKLGEVGEGRENDPYARLAHRLTTRRD